ncbi:MAG: hypothetical protein RMJ87_12605 [Cytophagales bacterium]|nr:hypothetical protein [Bernardetiaceae bacterium]MDW8205862.1 hypothetical protein [Cytophagales bacterium]
MLPLLFKKSLGVWLLFVCLIACTPQQDHTDRTALAKEMRGRKLKRVTDAQVISMAAEEGMRVVAQLKPLLVIPASGNCDSIRINGMLKNEVVAEYRFVCRPEPNMPSKVLEVWKAYTYNAQHNLTVAENIQKLDDPQLLLYTSPVVHNGKFIGMWSIVLSKKEMIRRL